MRVSPNKPHSAKKTAVSRANGIKLRKQHLLLSAAPTPANTTRHNELARTVVLESGSPERFCELLRSLEAAYMPETELETLLVESLSVTKRKQRRAVAAKAGNRCEAEPERRFDRGLARLLYLQSNSF
jgi:hypothetical protein